MTETPQPQPQPDPVPPQYTWATQPAPAPQPPAATPAAPAQARRKPRVIAVAAMAAVIAAAVSGGTTAIVLSSQDTLTPVAAPTQSSPAPEAPVKQSDPSSPDWSKTAAAVQPSVVAITVASSQSEAGGSGVILDAEGHVLTNNHVVSSTGSGSEIQVTLNDDRSYKAKVVGTDPSTDLAVLQIENPPKDLTPAVLGDSDAVEPGQAVMAVGNPLGLAGSVSTGIVSAVDRPVTTEQANPDQQFEPNNPAASSDSDVVVTNAIQTDAAINPGNSGGPLVDSGGRVIGINSSIISLSQNADGEGGNNGLGFAIPSNQAKNIAGQLMDSGKAEHAYLGVSAQDGSATLDGADRAAAVIKDVADGTPADDAGLQSGDAVIAVDGRSVDGAESLTAQVRAQAVGDKVTLTIVRDGQQQAVTVTLASAPAS